MRIHAGTFFAGVIYFLVGVAFILEALGSWDLTVSHLRYIGPLALVVAGLAVVIGSISRGDRPR